MGLGILDAGLAEIVAAILLGFGEGGGRKCSLEVEGVGSMTLI